MLVLVTVAIAMLEPLLHDYVKILGDILVSKAIKIIRVCFAAYLVTKSQHYTLNYIPKPADKIILL